MLTADDLRDGLIITTDLPDCPPNERVAKVHEGKPGRFYVLPLDESTHEHYDETSLDKQIGGLPAAELVQHLNSLKAYIITEQ